MTRATAGAGFSVVAAMAALAVVGVLLTVLLRDRNPAGANVSDSATVAPLSSATATLVALSGDIARSTAIVDLETGTLPPGFLLRSRADVEVYVTQTAIEPETVTIVDIRLVTLRDQMIEEANDGSRVNHGPDAEDEPFWRVEYYGSPAALRGACRIGSECPETARIVTWYRARDGDNASYKGRSPDDIPATFPQAEPPATFDTLPVDPRVPLLPDAEVVHVIVTTSTLFAGAEGLLTTEIWLDRVNDRSLVRTTRADGTLHWLEQRDGTTRVRYVAVGFDGGTMEPFYIRIEDVALEPGSWRVAPSTPHIDWYRSALVSGHARVVGETEYEGQLAIEVAVGYDDFAHTAYLNPANLLPLAVLLPSDQPPANGIFEAIQWLTVDSLAAEAVGDSVFIAVTPPDDRIDQRLLTHDLDPADIAGFAEYRVWGIAGTISAARRDAAVGESSSQEDRVTLEIGTGADRVTVTTYGRMREGARSGYLSDGGYVDEIEIDGNPAWLRQRRNSSQHDIALDRDGILIVISASNRAGAISAAESIEPLN